MKRRAEFIPYRPRTILNKSKRADHWFWTRYSAAPYVGCQHGCEFCYCREQKYCPHDDPADFPYKIKVKENAPELLRRALRRAPVDLISTGDYQPLEREFGISRRILEVCLEMGFPVFILERSPLVLSDLDVLQEIENRARAVVVFSVIYTPDSPHADSVRRLERLAPPPEKRFEAMRQIADAGILTGACMMPILPELCDDDVSLESVVQWTADHGGQFVLAGGLTLADQQRDHFFAHLRQHFPKLLHRYQSLYPAGSYGPSAEGRWGHTARRIRTFAEKHNIRDRMPRPIIPGDGRTLNRRIAESFAEQVYTLELENAPASRVWAYRKAAWAVEDLPQNIELVYRQMGRKGLENIPEITGSLAAEIESMVQAWGETGPGGQPDSDLPLFRTTPPAP